MTLLMHFSPLFFIEVSCFQNVQSLSVFNVYFLSLRKKYLGVFMILSHASHYHFTWCNLFVFNKTSIGHFIHIFFHKSDICYVQSSTGLMLLYITNELLINLWLQEWHFQWHVTSMGGHILLWKHVGFNSKKLFQKVRSVGERYTLA